MKHSMAPAPISCSISSPRFGSHNHHGRCSRPLLPLSRYDGSTGMANSGDCRGTLSAMSHGDLRPPSLSVCRPPKQRSRATFAFCRPIPPPAAPVRLVFPGVGDVVVTPPPPRIGDTAAPWVISFSPPPTAPKSTILVPPPRPDEAGPPPTLPPGRGRAHGDSQGLPDAALKFIIEVFIPDKRTAVTTPVPEIAVPTARCSSENRPDTVGTSENDMPESWTLAALASNPTGELAKLVEAVDSRIEIKIIVGSITLVLSGLAQFSVPGGELALTKILEAVLLEMNPKIGKGVLTLCASCAVGFLRTKNAAGAKPKDHA